MATPNKAQLLTDVQTLLKKRYKPKAENEKDHVRLTVLEAIVYAIAHENATRTRALEALGRFKSDFFDWNEVRVSTIDEVRLTLVPLANAEPRAQQVRRFLRQLFEKTYGFTLEALAKKPLKESLKVLAEYEAAESDYVLATVIQQSLGGHAIPIDSDCRRPLERLGVIDTDTEIAAVRSLIERAVSKTRGFEFRNLLEDLAHDTCVAGVPKCPDCELRKLCPFGIAQKDAVHQTAKLVKGKPAKPAAKTSAAKPSAPAPPEPIAESTPEPPPAKKVPSKSPKAEKDKEKDKGKPSPRS